MVKDQDELDELIAKWKKEDMYPYPQIGYHSIADEMEADKKKKSTYYPWWYEHEIPGESTSRKPNISDWWTRLAEWGTAVRGWKHA